VQVFWIYGFTDVYLETV